MATAAAPVAEAATDVKPAKGKKKLIIIIAAASVLVLALGGGTAAFFMKKKSADAAIAETTEGDGETHAPAKAAKHDAKAVIVMCSALGQESLVMEAIEAGASDFIVKPFKSEDVLSVVKKVLGDA